MTHAATEPAPISFSLAELPGHLGTEFAGEWQLVDQEMIPLFDRSTYVDDSQAGYDLTEYPVGMFEGLHTLGMILPLVESGFRIVDPNGMGLVYGFDRVRFTSPVHAGQSLRARGTITEIRPRGDGYVVAHDVTVEIQGQDVPAYVALFYIFYGPTGRIDLEPNADTVTRGSGA